MILNGRKSDHICQPKQKQVVHETWLAHDLEWHFLYPAKWLFMADVTIVNYHLGKRSIIIFACGSKMALGNV